MQSYKDCRPKESRTFGKFNVFLITSFAFCKWQWKRTVEIRRSLSINEYWQRVRYHIRNVAFPNCNNKCITTDVSAIINPQTTKSFHNIIFSRLFVGSENLQLSQVWYRLTHTKKNEKNFSGSYTVLNKTC